LRPEQSLLQPAIEISAAGYDYGRAKLKASP
jgi:hypothetical protein